MLTKLPFFVLKLSVKVLGCVEINSGVCEQDFHHGFLVHLHRVHQRGQRCHVDLRILHPNIGVGLGRVQQKLDDLHGVVIHRQ